MKSNRSRWLLRLALLPLIGIVYVLWASHEQEKYVLTVENRSDQPIAVLKVTIAGKTNTFQNVPIGSEVTAQLQSDEPCVLEGKLADGNMIRVRLALPPGEPSSVIVLPGGRVEVQKNKKK